MYLTPKQMYRFWHYHWLCAMVAHFHHWIKKIKKVIYSDFFLTIASLHLEIQTFFLRTVRCKLAIASYNVRIAGYKLVTTRNKVRIAREKRAILPFFLQFWHYFSELRIYISQFWLSNLQLHVIMKCLKGHGGGKKSGWVEKMWFSQNFCVPLRNFAFPWETLRSLAKHLHSLAKIFVCPRKTFAFSRTTSWVRTNTSCLFYSLQWFMQLRMFTM